MNRRNLIIIPSAIISILFPIYLVIYSLKYRISMEFAVSTAIALLIILISSLVLFNIKLPTALKILLLIISILIALLSTGILGVVLYRFISNEAISRTTFFITFYVALASITITMLAYAIQALKISDKILLIILGIACAAISVAGIMCYHNSSGASGPAISKSISRLYLDDLDAREQAQQELIKIGAPAESAVLKETFNPDPSVRLCARYILKVIRLEKRVRFSKTLQDRFPDISKDPDYLLNSGKLDAFSARDKFNILLKIISQDKKGRYPYQGVATDQDLAGLIADIMADDTAQSDQPLDTLSKQVILAVCAGTEFSFCSMLYNRDITTGWPKAIPQAFPSIIKLLDDEDDETRGLAAICLVEIGLKDKVPEKSIADIAGIRDSQGQNPSEKIRAANALKKLGRDR